MKGGFGEVRIEQGVAVKTVHRGTVRHEYDVLRTLSHANIVRVYSCTDTVLYMEAAGLDWLTLESIPPALKRDQARQLLDGVAYLHGQRVAHRDLKLENVTTDPTGRVRIVDFGLARRVAHAGVRCCSAKVGSKLYMAPEMWTDAHYDPMAADVWSLGVVVYALWHGNLLFAEANDDDRRFSRFRALQGAQTPSQAVLTLYEQTVPEEEAWVNHLIDCTMRVNPRVRMKLY